MSPLAKLGGFAVVLVLALVLGLGLGAAVGPIDVGGTDHTDGPVHDDGSGSDGADDAGHDGDHWGPS